MPAWLIALIIFLLIALSSQNERSHTAGRNSNEGYRSGNEAEENLNKRFDSCGSRCDDAKNDYRVKIEKE